ncbi:MAG: YitT family protein [Parachlamydiaceae bacterium]|nr:YitT family protein [Parachlamydiaceae bacterium]
MHSSHVSAKSFGSQVLIYLAMALGAFLVAVSIDLFLLPNSLIDGGTIGIAMILANLFGKNLTGIFALLLNLPFLYLAYRSIGKAFVLHALFSNVLFLFFSYLLHHYFPYPFIGESLEIVVIGGAILGMGVGLIIRYGGCLDGTEILGIIINRRTGITVGQVVLVCNIFVFGACGLVFQDWHPPLLSLIMYMVVIKVMDAVVVGLDETKSVLIISTESRAIAEAIVHELGLGLTVMYGRGGFSGDAREILYVIAERLQLADLKEIIYREDPSAFIAIENLHEVANGKQGYRTPKKKNRIGSLFSSVLAPAQK